MTAQTHLVHIIITYPSIMKMQISSGFEVDPTSIKVEELKEKAFNSAWTQVLSANLATEKHGIHRQVILQDESKQAITTDENLRERLSSGSTCFSVVFSRS